MNPSKEQITVTVTFLRLEAINSFTPKHSQHHKLDVFLSSSKASSKQFRFFQGVTDFTSSPETLQVKNVVGTKIQFWLNCTYPMKKLIGVAFLEINLDNSEELLILKLQNQEFAKLEVVVKVDRRSIERQIFVEPDEIILRKKVDPDDELRRLQEQQMKKLKEQQQREQKQQKLRRRPIITLLTQNKKQEPFI